MGACRTKGRWKPPGGRQDMGGGAMGTNGDQWKAGWGHVGRKATGCRRGPMDGRGLMGGRLKAGRGSLERRVVERRRGDNGWSGADGRPGGGA